MNAELPGAQMFFDAAHWIAWSAPYLAALVLVAGIFWVWTAWQRAQRVQRALADRVRVEVVPTSTFDPAEGEIGRWAHHLGRVRYAAAETPARGAAARLRYTVEDGKMRCYLEGPGFWLSCDADLGKPLRRDRIVINRDGGRVLPRRRRTLSTGPRPEHRFRGRHDQRGGPSVRSRPCSITPPCRSPR
ncbi:hypothetical protein ACFWOJ_31970 [Streptomyces sp. NPDC058439]|uniref:hypothetical protein n=1 Tax=Streptomyces sp. NPDC058439 TaxID=3346500 RepID=UPI00365B8914